MYKNFSISFKTVFKILGNTFLFQLLENKKNVS